MAECRSRRRFRVTAQQADFARASGRGRAAIRASRRWSSAGSSSCAPRPRRARPSSPRSAAARGPRGRTSYVAPAEGRAADRGDDRGQAAGAWPLRSSAPRGCDRDLAALFDALVAGHRALGDTPRRGARPRRRPAALDRGDAWPASAAPPSSAAPRRGPPARPAALPPTAVFAFEPRRGRRESSASSPSSPPARSPSRHASPSVAAGDPAGWPQSHRRPPPPSPRAGCAASTGREPSPRAKRELGDRARRRSAEPRAARRGRARPAPEGGCRARCRARRPLPPPSSTIPARIAARTLVHHAGCWRTLGPEKSRDVAIGSASRAGRQVLRPSPRQELVGHRPMRRRRASAQRPSYRPRGVLTVIPRSAGRSAAILVSVTPHPDGGDGARAAPPPGPAG